MAMFVSLASPEEQLGEVVVSIAKLRNDPEPPTATLELVREGKHLEVMKGAINDAEIAFESGTNEVLLYSALVALSRTTLPEHADALAETVIEKVSSVTDRQTEARLQVLVAVHNLLVQAPGREKALRAAVDYIAATGQEQRVGDRLTPAAVKKLVAGAEVALQREVYRKLLAVMRKAGQSDANVYEVLLALLATWEGDEADVAAAKDVAAEAAKLAVSIPAVHEITDVLALKAVQALKGDKDHGALFDLASLFATERLAALEAFEGKNPNFFKDSGIDRDAAFKKMRLLSLASLAAESPVVPYDDVMSTLNVGEDDVETWVIEAIGAKLIEAKMNQLTRVVKIQGCVHRSFERAHWEKIQKSVNEWKSNVSSLLVTLKDSAAAAR